MIICAARLQQVRTLTPNLRLSLHSTKAPTEHRDLAPKHPLSDVTLQEESAMNGNCRRKTSDDHLCGKIAARTGMGPKLTTGVSQHHITQ